MGFLSRTPAVSRPGTLRRMGARAVAVLTISAAGVLGLGVAAQASGQQCTSTGGLHGHSACIEWTGGYPGGQVWLIRGDNGVKALKLLTCSNANSANCSWNSLSTVHGASSTPRFPVGKYSWYVGCWSSAAGSDYWWCDYGDAVYLGD